MAAKKAKQSSGSRSPGKSLRTRAAATSHAAKTRKKTSGEKPPIKKVAKRKTGKAARRTMTAKKAAKTSTRSRLAKVATKSRKRTTATPAEKKTAKKSTAKQVAVNKAAAKKTAGRKIAGRKAKAKKAPAKKSVAKKTSVKKAGASKQIAQRKQRPPHSDKTAPLKKAQVGKKSAIRRGGRKKISRAKIQEEDAPLQPQVNNQPLDRSQIRELGKYLKTERQRLAQEIMDLERVSISNSSGERSPEHEGYSIHMAEAASDYQMVELALLQNSVEMQLLRMIDESMLKIKNKTYGACERCTANIGYERLLAKPFARLCIVCRNAMERGKV